MYKVIKLFTDLQDNNFKYEAGDTFPRKGLDVSEARFKELSSSENKRGVPLIEYVEDEKSVVTEKETDVIESIADVTESVADEKPKRKRKIKDAE